jgi:hypothetical protein
MLITCGLILFVLSGLPAQSDPVTTMGLSGATGLYVLPTGRVSWYDQNFGFNAGYHFTVFDGYDPGYDDDDDLNIAHNTGINFGFLKWFETSLAFDFQPGYWTRSSGDNHDLLIGAKVQLPFKNESYPAVALGGNFQFLNLGGEDKSAQNEYGSTSQIYAAVTYAATFFGSPVETTAVVGKTFVINTTAHRKKSKTDIDFGMGLDVIIFPKTLQNYVHWIAEYSNFSYSNDPLGADAEGRGVMNTGLRVDLSQIPALNKFNFTVDVMGTDLLDHRRRAFSLGAVFGMSVL